MSDNYEEEPDVRINSVLDILIAEKIVTQENIDTALEQAEAEGVSPSAVLLKAGIITPQELTRAIAKTLKTDFIDLSEFPISREMSDYMREDVAKKFTIVPIKHDGTTKLTVAVTIKNAMNLDLNDNIRRRTKFSEVEFVVAMPEQIKNTIKDLYRADDELRKISEDAASSASSGPTVDDLDEEVVITDESDVERFVRLAITQGIADRASDIIFECHENYLSVRYRIDSVFHEKARAPKEISDEIISVIKIKSDMDISIRRKAQDGRMFVMHNNEKVDLRVNILPIQDGENVTMRVLDNSQANLKLEELGFSASNLSRFKKAIHQPYGMVLVTGPTGSGKSVTLYSALTEIASPEKNTHTIEDPIEYRVPYVKQSQLAPKAGWTYPEAIRAFMRAAPNVILVGEIRDLDTASVALQAGMTGHLVLSTLHTNSSSEVPARLMDLGVQPHIISSTLTAMVAQRLVRRLCSKCKVPHTPTAEELLAVGFTTAPNKPWTEADPIPTLYAPSEKGCKECSFIGFRGRTAAHEVLLVDEPIRTLISSKAESHIIEQKAIEGGMSRMIEDGFQKVMEGITTIPEVLKSIV